MRFIQRNKNGLTSTSHITTTTNGFTKTDVDGQFQFKEVQDGTYDVSVMEKDFCQETIGPLVVTGGVAPTNLIIRLSQGGTVAGIITDHETGLPISNACINDRTAMGKITPHGYEDGFSDKNGQYTISHIKAGTCKLLAWAEGYGQVAASVQIVEGQKTTKDFSLSKGGTVTFLISDEAGYPVSGAAIEIRDSKGEEPPFNDFFGTYIGNKSGVDGKSVWTSLGEGEYTVTVSKDRFSAASTNFSIRHGEETLVKIGLRK